MGDHQRVGKPSQYVTATEVNSAVGQQNEYQLSG